MTLGRVPPGRPRGRNRGPLAPWRARQTPKIIRDTGSLDRALVQRLYTCILLRSLHAGSPVGLYLVPGGGGEGTSLSSPRRTAPARPPPARLLPPDYPWGPAHSDCRVFRSSSVSGPAVFRSSSDRVCPLMTTSVTYLAAQAPEEGQGPPSRLHPNSGARAAREARAR